MKTQKLVSKTKTTKAKTVKAKSVSAALKTREAEAPVSTPAPVIPARPVHPAPPVRPVKASVSASSGKKIFGYEDREDAAFFLREKEVYAANDPTLLQEHPELCTRGILLDVDRDPEKYGLAGKNPVSYTVKIEKRGKGASPFVTYDCFVYVREV